MLVYLFRNYIKKKNQYEHALLESKQKAEELAKAKESFLANMSHEIKTPLNAIYGFTEQILSGELNPEQKIQLNVVKSSAAYLTKLVNDILTYAKLQSGKSQLEITSFNLKKEFSEIVELFKNQANSKGILLLPKIDEFFPEIIKSDKNKLKQVIFNIFGNAIKFTNKGEVKISLKIIESKETNLLRIVVSDTGIGIDENKLPKLFKEFEQGDAQINKKYGGSGLGLVITKQIIEQLSGKINITSKENVGTKVTITIPVEISTELQVKSENDINLVLDYEKLIGTKILIVDDEEFNRLLFKSILKKYQVEVFEAENGETAINLIKNHLFNLIIMDIRMPEKNGIETTKEIRIFNQKLPILASTAEISEENIVKCVSAGMNGLVFKPFTEKELLEKIIEAISGNNKTENKKFPIVEIIPEAKKTNQRIINLDNITEYSNGDENFRKEMLQLFYNSINKALNQIEEFVETKNYSNVSEVAHKIIPSCKHFEAYELYNILKYFENLKNIQNVELIEIKKNLEELRNQINIINKELELLL